MKKVIVCLSSLLFAGFAIAAGTAHFTETVPPASPSGAVGVANGYDWSLTTNNVNTVPSLALPLYTLAVATTSLISSTTGQVIFVTTAKGGGAAGTICVSTGSTATNQFVLSTGTVCQ